VHTKTNGESARRYPANRRKRRSTKEVTERLVQAAADEFRRCGFASATTSAIARNAGVTESLIFRYFGSKVGLFREAIFKPLEQHFAEFNARHLTEVKVEDVRDLTPLYVTELQRFVAEHSEMLLSLFVAQTYAPDETREVGEIDSLNTYFQRATAMMTRTCPDKSPKVDHGLMVRLSFGAVLASVIFKDLLFPPGVASNEKISTAVIDFVMEGIGTHLPRSLKPPA
jgi:AcrR family transcriptional regulator